MSFYYSGDSLQDIHQVLMGTLNDDFDYESAPRGKPIRELIAASFTLTNPRNRLIDSPARNVNYGFAVGELCWYVRGDDDLATMLYYNKRMSQFSDDGKTINSAYGYRMFKDRWLGRRFTGMGHEIEDKSQLDNIIQELVKDPDSRRAVMHINEPGDLYRAVMDGSKDVPCTMSIQLLIRDRKLHMHVLMRSNDVVWGLPYDVFSFTCLQETFPLQATGAGRSGG
jgi:thymidylate synthase